MNKKNCIFAMYFITQKAGKPAYLTEAYYIYAKSPYGGSEPPCGALMRPLPSVVKYNGKGGTVLFLS